MLGTYARPDDVMCEGCAEDTLEATLSNAADAAFGGLDEPAGFESEFLDRQG